MSNKSAKPPKKLSVPRSIAEIQEEANQLYFKAGQCEYQAAVYTEELKSLNERLRTLNNEAHSRNELDKDKTVVQLPEVTNE